MHDYLDHIYLIVPRFISYLTMGDVPEYATHNYHYAVTC